MQSDTKSRGSGLMDLNHRRIGPEPIAERPPGKTPKWGDFPATTEVVGSL